MDLLHTGSNNILTVQAGNITVIIKGKSSHKYFHNLSETETKCSSVYIKSIDPFFVYFADGREEDSQSIETEPLFFEQQQYEILIESKNTDENLFFWHENKNIREDVSNVGNHKNLLSGILNFGNDIGYSDLIICSEKKEVLRIRIEIFPSKISYKEDYKALIQDVTSEVYNLIFDFLKKTYFQFGINNETKASPAEFYSIIERIFKDFERAINIVLRSPHHILETKREVLPSYKTKRIDYRSKKWIQNHPEFIKREGNLYNVQKILTPRKQVTYDTKENQFLKFILMSTKQKLKNFEANYILLGGNVQPEIIAKIHRMIGSVDKYLNTTFLSEVSISNTSNLMSLVFTMAPGYREIYRYYLMIQHGLSLTGDIFNLSLKDVADLYEYWCFIKINRILKDKKYTLVTPDILKVETRGLTVNLQKGKTSTVRYLNPKNDEIIEVSYNPSERKSPTGPQKPDNVLSIKKKGNSIYQYVFDAKYRIDNGSDSNDAERQTPGPKEDAINTMHRYRDAIVCEALDTKNFNLERSMFGAYVLFPYNNEKEYKNHKFYKSIEKVNIGGLPFLPSATSLVENFLEELIEDTPDSAFNRSVLPYGIENKLKSIDWDNKDVLIGMLRNKEQLDKNIEYRFYHIPADKIEENDLPIHWIALYQSQNIFDTNSGIYYFGEIIRCYKTKRKDIKEIPCKPENAEKVYYRFDIKRWNKLETPIGVREFGPPEHRFTNLFLLQNSTVFPELFLKDEEEYRLYNEIKYRISNPEYVENPFGFRINDNTLFFDNKEIIIMEGSEIVDRILFSEFLKYPHAIFKQIQDICKNKS